MKSFALVALILIVALSSTSAFAAVILSEDWESGTDGWSYVGSGPYPVLSTDQSVSASHSVRTADDITASYTNAMDYQLASPTEPNWTATWYFYDTGASRRYLQLYSYSADSTLQQLICLGVYNAGDVSKYSYRVAYGSSLGTGGWGDTTVDRVSNVWHAMMVQQTYNDGDPTATVDFYVDNVLGATATTTAVYGVTKVRVGSGADQRRPRRLLRRYRPDGRSRARQPAGAGIGACRPIGLDAPKKRLRLGRCRYDTADGYHPTAFLWYMSRYRL